MQSLKCIRYDNTSSNNAASSTVGESGLTTYRPEPPTQLKASKSCEMLGRHGSPPRPTIQH
jgi:hypothetical protein